MSQPDAVTVPIDVVVRGSWHPGIADYAEKRLRAALRAVHEPVLHVRARITQPEDPTVAGLVVAQAVVDVNGRIVRAQAAGATAPEAVDLLHDRLRRRLQRDRSRAGGHWEDRRGAQPASEPGEWRHGAPPADRVGYFPRPADARTIVRRKSVTPRRCGVDEAVFDMEQMDYGFHLFTEESSGQDSVVHRDDSGYRLAQVEPHPGDLAPYVTPLTVSSTPAPVLRIDEAVEQMGLRGGPFLFFRDAGSGRGTLLYHRYDGHYGLIVPAE